MSLAWLANKKLNLPVEQHGAYTELGEGPSSAKSSRSTEESKFMKRHAAQMLTLFAKTYFVIVLFTASWALYTDVTLLNSQREHLAPDILLLIVTLPSSSSLTYLYDALPQFFSGRIVQVGWLTLCGIGQAWLLVALTRVFNVAVDGHHHQ